MASVAQYAPPQAQTQGSVAPAHAPPQAQTPESDVVLPPKAPPAVLLAWQAAQRAARAQAPAAAQAPGQPQGFKPPLACLWLGQAPPSTKSAVGGIAQQGADGLQPPPKMTLPPQQPAAVSPPPPSQPARPCSSADRAPGVSGFPEPWAEPTPLGPRARRTEGGGFAFGYGSGVGTEAWGQQWHLSEKRRQGQGVPQWVSTSAAGGSAGYKILLGDATQTEDWSARAVIFAYMFSLNS